MFTPERCWSLDPLEKYGRYKDYDDINDLSSAKTRYKNEVFDKEENKAKMTRCS